MLTSEQKAFQTMEERWNLIHSMADMITTDFGIQDGIYDPDDPGNRARHALLEIGAAYKHFGQIDAIAEALLADIDDEPDIDLENVTLPE